DLYPDPAERRKVQESIGAPIGQWTDFRTRTRQGTMLETIWANAPLTGGGWLAIGMDVSDRKRAEERYRSFIAQSSEGVSRLEIDPPVPINLPEEEQIDRLYGGRALRSATTRWRACMASAKRASWSAPAWPTCTRCPIRRTASRSAPSSARAIGSQTPR